MARQDCQQLAVELRTTTLDYLARLARSSNGAEIVGLARHFNQALRQRPVSEVLLARLGLANLYGWAAYTIYDDFLDEEGQPALLPTATVVLRYALQAFQKALPDNPTFQALVQRTFDTIDSANAWEQAHCRFQRQGPRLVVGPLPDYGDLQVLADRSLGHCLAPLAVLCADGMAAGSAAMRHVETAMRHYLIARQLNDDAHDWQADLEKGHVSYVAARILAEADIRPGTHLWSQLLPVARRQFWHGTLPGICQTIREQTALSRHNIAKLPTMRHQNVITGFLDAIEASVDETLAAQDQARRFLRQYSQAGQAVGS